MTTMGKDVMTVAVKAMGKLLLLGVVLVLTPNPPCFGEDLVADEGLVTFASEMELEDDAVLPVGYAHCLACQGTQCNGDCYQSRWGRRWDGAFELGLNGTEGNSRNVNLVVGFDAKREEGRRTTTLDIDYLYARDEIETTKNRLYSLIRQEYDVPDSDWDWFHDFWFEYDPLEEFRARIGLHVGRVATLWETENCKLQGLVGIGATKEIQGMDTAWKPEIYLGSNFERTINDRQNFYVRSILLPDLGNFKSYRLRIRAGWECALNEKETWKLSISMFDRYDSTPSGADRRNDIDYWVSLLWKF